MSAREQVLELGPLPFYWRIRRSAAERHPTIPGRIPYTFGYLPELNLVIEKREPSLLAILKEMYREESNIGFLQDGHSLAKGYGGDFLDFIQRQLAGRAVRRVVEVGCGACYMLERLREAGCEVTGVDPSPIAVAKGREKGIRVIPDFYPSPLIDFKADLIFHADVLEHVEDPAGFLRLQKDGLGPDGLLIANVPDCTASIARGDISIATHQHLNSFDERSLYNTMTAAGLHVVTIEKSKFGGSLYGLASVRPPATPFRTSVPEENARLFIARASAARARFAALAQGKSLGFYMPLRSLPYLAGIGRLDGVRLFDDIAHWHGGYVDGLDTPIENFEDLVRNPVEHLFVMSLTFGDVVREKVLARVPGIRITTLGEIVAA
jgi:SAM-dependent methyltransferase